MASGAGHRVCVVSGTLAVLARELVRQLPGPVDLIATELETASGYIEDAQRSAQAIWTGEISGVHMAGLRRRRGPFGATQRITEWIWHAAMHMEIRTRIYQCSMRWGIPWL